MSNNIKSQSPLVGAFVPAHRHRLHPGRVQGRNPLWSGHSFRPHREEFDTVDYCKSQSPLVGAFVPANRGKPHLQLGRAVAIPSGRGIRSGPTPEVFENKELLLSQSPLVGAFVPAQASMIVKIARDEVAIPSGRGIRSGIGLSLFNILTF